MLKDLIQKLTGLPSDTCESLTLAFCISVVLFLSVVLVKIFT